MNRHQLFQPIRAAMARLAYEAACRLHKINNNAAGTLSAGIGTGDLTISLTAGHGARFPATSAQDFFMATLIDNAGNVEIIKVTDRATDTLTVVRAQDGTTAKVFSAGDKIEMRPHNAATLYMQQEALQAVAGAGTDTYTGTLSPAPKAWNTEQVYVVKFPNANTSATPTLNLNSFGAKTIKKGGGRALLPGDIEAGMTCFLHYNGTDLILLNPAKGVLRGKNTVWVPAGAMVPRTSNPAGGPNVTELATNKVNLRTFDFDAGADEFTQFQIKMPKGWDEGTVTAKFVWTAASSSGDVVWGIQAVAHSNDDALDAAFGSAVEVTDTLLAVNDQHLSAETAAVTIGGTPAEEDLVTFQVYRNADAGGDTLAADAKLIGVELIINLTAADDS